MKRILIALGIAAVTYGTFAAVGTILYATGHIATGATHNDCADYKAVIAKERGIDEHDVSQSEVSARTQECLDQHALGESEAFRTEFLFWSIWPAVVSAGAFLLWPAWTRALHKQELADPAREAPRLEMGT